MGFLSEAAQATIAEHEARRRERLAGDRPLFDTAFTIGDHRLAAPGCEAWSNPQRRANTGYSEEPEPAGGVILEITSAPAVTDDGEIVHRRAYRCYDYSPGLPPHRRYVTLTEDQVAGFDAPDMARIRGLARRLAHQAKTRGTMGPAELEAITTAARLAAIVGQTRT